MNNQHIQNEEQLAQAIAEKMLEIVKQGDAAGELRERARGFLGMPDTVPIEQIEAAIVAQNVSMARAVLTMVKELGFEVVRST